MLHAVVRAGGTTARLEPQGRAAARYRQVIGNDLRSDLDVTARPSHLATGAPCTPNTAAETVRAVDGSVSADAVPYEAFSKVALTYFHELCGTARRLTRNTADADDLVQETYHLALLHYRELRSLRYCRPWLYRILRRRALTHYRRQRSALSVAMPGGAVGDISAPSTFDGDLLEHISLQEIRDAINALPADLRGALTLCDIEGFSYAEIADIAACPVGTVRSRIARARAKLMRTLQAHAEDRGIRGRAA